MELSSVGEGKLLFTTGLLFLSSCNDPLKPPGHLTSPLAQDVFHTSALSTSEPLPWVGRVWNSCVQGPCAHGRAFSPVSLLPVCSTIWQPKEPEEGRGIFYFSCSAFPVLNPFIPKQPCEVATIITCHSRFPVREHLAYGHLKGHQINSAPEPFIMACCILCCPH